MRNVAKFREISGEMSRNILKLMAKCREIVGEMSRNVAKCREIYYRMHEIRK